MNQLNHLPSAVVSLVTSCPTAGQGVHRWTWETALALRPYLERNEAERLMRIASRDCGRNCFRDIEDSVGKAFNSALDAKRQRPNHGRHAAIPPSKKIGHQVNDSLRREIVQSTGGLDALRSASRTPLPSGERELAPYMLDILFPADPLLCVGWEPHLAETRRKSYIEKPYRYQLVVPNPMSAPWGVNQDGKRSVRCLDNTGPRVYLICEFDLPIDFESPPTIQSPRAMIDRAFVRWATSQGKTITDICASLIRYLASALPLVAVVDSGGKSLHGWFNVMATSEVDLQCFMAIAIRLGADPATFVRCQFVRMPGGVRLRDDGQTASFQQVIYFDADSCMRLQTK